MTRNDVEVAVNGYFRRHKVKGVNGKVLLCPPERTVRQHAEYRIIPGPTGNTRAADWTAWTPAEEAATVFLQERGWTVGRLYAARGFIRPALESERRLVTAELDQLYDDDSPHYADAATWAISVLKVHLDWPVHAPVTIVEGLDEHTRARQYLAMPPIQREGEHPVAIDRLLRVDKLGG